MIQICALVILPGTPRFVRPVVDVGMPMSRPKPTITGTGSTDTWSYCVRPFLCEQEILHIRRDVAGQKFGSSHGTSMQGTPRTDVTVPTQEPCPKSVSVTESLKIWSSA